MSRTWNPDGLPETVSVNLELLCKFPVLTLYLSQKYPYHFVPGFPCASYRCNLKLRINPVQQRIPVVFHNLKGYDSHHIISNIGKTKTDIITYTDRNGRERVSDLVCNRFEFLPPSLNVQIIVCVFVCVTTSLLAGVICMVFFFQSRNLGAISVIATNTEKFISFSWRQYQFIDSLAFLNTSLDRLAQTTPADAFQHTTARFTDPEEVELILRKGVYPYEYMDSFKKFDETTLPPQDAFYSSLSGAVGSHL